MSEYYKGYYITTEKHPKAGERCWLAKCEDIGDGSHWSDDEQRAVDLVKWNIDRHILEQQRNNSIE